MVEYSWRQKEYYKATLKKAPNTVICQGIEIFSWQDEKSQD